jgi:hypothetical protein
LRSERFGGDGRITFKSAANSLGPVGQEEGQALELVESALGCGLRIVERLRLALRDQFLMAWRAE